MKNTADIVAAHIAQIDYEDLPSSAIERAKERLIDGIGAAVVGYSAVGNDGLRQYVKELGGKTESTILVDGGKVPAAHAAFVNSITARSYDFEMVEAEGPAGVTGPGHISGSSLPTALAVAEACGSSGKELLTALIVGDDLASRLSIATGFAFGAGWDNTGTVNGFACAAIAAKLLKLDEEKTREALSLVLNQLGGTMDNVRDRAMAFKLPQGLSARNGIFSAGLAGSGFQASRDPFTGHNGYFHFFGGDNADPHIVTRELGQVFYGDCVIKPWPCCRLNHPALDAVFQILAEHDLNPEAIKAVTLHLNDAAELVDAPFITGSAPQVAAAFNIRFVVAAALVNGELKPKHFTMASFKDPRILALIDKIKLDYDIPKKQMMRAVVDIVTTDRRTYRAETATPKGDLLQNPLSREEVLAKYYDNMTCNQTFTTVAADQILAKITRFEELDRIDEFIALLVKKSKGR